MTENYDTDMDFNQQELRGRWMHVTEDRHLKVLGGKSR